MITVELMSEKHVQQIAELEMQCFSMPWSEASIRYELTNPLALWLVAVDGDVVAGYVGSQTVMDEADMMNIAVRPDRRREGLAERLVETLVGRLRERDVRCLTLEVRASNEAAKALYTKLGFQYIGRRPNYYRMPKEDALILRKEWLI